MKPNDLLFLSRIVASGLLHDMFLFVIIRWFQTLCYYFYIISLNCLILMSVNTVFNKSNFILLWLWFEACAFEATDCSMQTSTHYITAVLYFSSSESAPHRSPNINSIEVGMCKHRAYWIYGNLIHTAQIVTVWTPQDKNVKNKNFHEILGYHSG
jgi:hypothetical protein